MVCEYDVGGPDHVHAIWRNFGSGRPDAYDVACGCAAPPRFLLAAKLARVQLPEAERPGRQVAERGRAFAPVLGLPVATVATHAAGPSQAMPEAEIVRLVRWLPCGDVTVAKNVNANAGQPGMMRRMQAEESD